MKFPRQEYWSGLLFPPPRDLPDPGIKLMCPVSPAWAGRLFTISATGMPSQNDGVEDFPGDPVVKKLPCKCMGFGFDLWN